MSTYSLLILEPNEDTQALLTAVEPRELAAEVVEKRLNDSPRSSRALDEIVARKEFDAFITGFKVAKLEIPEHDIDDTFIELRGHILPNGLVAIWDHSSEPVAFGDEVRGIGTQQWYTSAPWASPGRVTQVVEQVKQRQSADADPANPDSVCEFVTYSDLESDEYHYCQLSYRPTAESFVLEFRKGFDEADDHHHAFLSDQDEVVALIGRWFQGEEPYEGDERFLPGMPAPAA